VLLKSVLESILVFWNSITTFPRGILEKIRRINCRYLWASHKTMGMSIWLVGPPSLCQNKLGMGRDSKIFVPLLVY
jgi:hypothetical protein